MLPLLVLLACQRPPAGGDDTAPDGDTDTTGGSACDEPLPADAAVSLPADDGVHDEDIEWWYWTGHLQAGDGRWFGFEQVFFAAVYQGQKVRMTHVAVADVDAQAFSYDVAYAFEAPEAVEDGFSFAVGENTASGGGGHDVLHGETGDAALDLELTARKRPVLQHGTGYTEYSFGGYTYYYSRERMDAVGTLTIGGGRIDVTGSAWFDHQWGSLEEAVSTGWDWFAIQLDDDREIMLFEMRPETGTELVGGSYTDADCRTTEVTAYTITPTGEWVNDEGCVYPSGWEIEVEGLHLVVTPVVLDQELPDAYPPYWEGAATVTGDATGRAYIELTGYCD